jgi:hypothetical protein
VPLGVFMSGKIGATANSIRAHVCTLKQARTNCVDTPIVWLETQTFTFLGYLPTPSLSPIWPDDSILEVSTCALDFNISYLNDSSELPTDVRSEDVTKFFEGVGRVVDCRVMTGRQLRFFFFLDSAC